MPSRFTDARELMSDLLDRFEAGTASPISYPDYSGFPDVVAIDKFAKELREAEAAGQSGSQTGRDEMATRSHTSDCRLPRACMPFSNVDRSPSLSMRQLADC
jgi:hypothetical protein